MQTRPNPWDDLAETFQTGDDHKTASIAADNVSIAWPVIRKEIEHLPKQRHTHIIDFGCGSGGFCRTMCRDGYRVTGIDSSYEMIERARRSPCTGLSYIHGDETSLERIALKADAITAIMVAQFIEEPDKLINASYKALKKEGLFVMAAFNPGFIERCIKANKLFEKATENPGRYSMQLADKNIPTYARTEEEYTAAFEQRGFIKEGSCYPRFTEEFLRLFKWELPTDVPEYMILTFRKNCQSKPSTE